jgi:hypothetical protein
MSGGGRMYSAARSLVESQTVAITMRFSAAVLQKLLQ